MRFLPEIASCALLLFLLLGGIAWVRRDAISEFFASVLEASDVTQ